MMKREQQANGSSPAAIQWVIETKTTIDFIRCAYVNNANSVDF